MNKGNHHSLFVSVKHARVARQTCQHIQHTTKLSKVIQHPTKQLLQQYTSLLQQHTPSFPTQVSYTSFPHTSFPSHQVFFLSQFLHQFVLAPIRALAIVWRFLLHCPLGLYCTCVTLLTLVINQNSIIN